MAPNIFKKGDRNTGTESFPITLNRKKTYILPTRYGYLFIVLLIVMLIGSANYNNNLGFLLTFLLSSMCVISLYYTSNNIKGIQIVSARAEPVFAGDPAIFELTFMVTGADRPSVNVTLSNQQEIEPITLFFHEDNQIRRSKISSNRGILKPGSITISTDYPFGIFRSWSTIHVNLNCYVYPKPIFSSTEFDTGSSQHNGATNLNRSGADDFQGLVEYQPGDSLQHVSWKKLSAGQGLFTKKFDGLSGNNIKIDWLTLPTLDPETKLSIMCGMILKAHRMNLEYELRLPGTTIEQASGNQHKNRCLKSLSLFQNPVPEFTEKS
jgi:uncharacterized protein (DUF58 family)